MSEIQCKIFGRVQGVFYRAFVKDVASDLGIFGTVRNAEDGTVEVLAQGSDDILNLFIEQLRGGSPLSNVESIDVNWSGKETKLELDEFIIIY